MKIYHVGVVPSAGACKVDKFVLVIAVPFENVGKTIIVIINVVVISPKVARGCYTGVVRLEVDTLFVDLVTNEPFIARDDIKPC